MVRQGVALRRWLVGAVVYSGNCLDAFMYLFAPIFAAIGLIITIIIESLSRKLAAARKVQHINTSRPYDLAEIRQRARQAAGLSDEA